MMKKKLLLLTMATIALMIVSCSSQQKQNKDDSEANTITEEIADTSDEQSDDIDQVDADTDHTEDEQISGSNTLEKVMGNKSDWIGLKVYEDEWPVYVNKNVRVEGTNNRVVIAYVLFDMSRANRRHSSSSKFIDDDHARGHIKSKDGLRETPYFIIEERHHMYWDNYILKNISYYNKEGELIKQYSDQGTSDVISDYNESIRDKIKELAASKLN
ncbi:MAG: hypothetical protein J6S96_03535 [Muribaculaceae bacterium]|nr:hypothetical protein [Muribaculaceae bacterium]